MSRRTLVAPFLPESLPVPALTAFSQRVLTTYVLDQAHVFHVLNHTEELVIRGTSDLSQHREGHLSISLQVLSNFVFADRSGIPSSHYMAAVGAEKIALGIIPCDFLAPAYRASCLCKS